MKKIFILTLILIVGSLNAQDITNNRFGKGLINVFAKDSSWSSKVAFRYQTRYEGNFDLEESDYTGRASYREPQWKKCIYIHNKIFLFKTKPKVIIIIVNFCSCVRFMGSPIRF